MTSFANSYGTRKTDPTGDSNNHFGKSVAIQPGLALVGIPDNQYEDMSGTICVYVEDDKRSNWWLIREIKDGMSGDLFGWAIALHSDNFAVVGAPKSNHFGYHSGFAYYMFIETDPNGYQEEPKEIFPSMRHNDAHFGYSVAISQSHQHVRVAIGAYGLKGQGGVMVYTRMRDNTLGNEQVCFASDPTTNGWFGQSVGLSNRVLAVGAPSPNGGAYVFELDAQDQYIFITKLSTKHAISMSDDILQDSFGAGVASSDNYVIVTAPLSSARADAGGVVYVYLRTVQQDVVMYTFSQTLFSSLGYDQFYYGFSISLDHNSNRLVIGGDYTFQTTTAHVDIYSADATTSYFTKVVDIQPMDLFDEDFKESQTSRFGHAVSLSGDYLAVGGDFGQDVFFYKAQT
jgi:hypothetical protein